MDRLFMLRSRFEEHRLPPLRVVAVDDRLLMQLVEFSEPSSLVRTRAATPVAAYGVEAVIAGQALVGVGLGGSLVVLAAAVVVHGGRRRPLAATPSSYGRAWPRNGSSSAKDATPRRAGVDGVPARRGRKALTRRGARESIEQLSRLSQHLIGLRITHPHALQRLYTLTTCHPGLHVRLFRVADSQAFHPKAYIFVRGRHGATFGAKRGRPPVAPRPGGPGLVI